MCSYVPVKEMKVIDVPRKWNQMKNDPRSYVRNLCNCIRGCIAPVSRGHGFKPRWSPEFCCLFIFQILRGSFFIWFTHFSWLSIKRTLGSGPKVSALERVPNVKWERESARKGLNATSGTQFAALPLVKPVYRSARAPCRRCYCVVLTKSAYSRSQNICSHLSYL